MDIIKLSTDWAKAEVFSAKIVWLFSVIELLAAIGFWYWGIGNHHTNCSFSHGSGQQYYRQE